jgi:hypothetical protein
MGFNKKKVLSSVNEMVWRIKTEGKDHVVGYKAGVDDGEVLLDGNIVDSKGSSYMGVLMKMSFTIEGKPAKVQRRGLLSENWELVYDGRVYAPPERAGLTIEIKEV